MALEEYNNNNQVWLRIKHGTICEDSKTEREGYKKVEGVLRDGTAYKKWIRPYRAVSGYVNKIEWYAREFDGRKFRGWNISIDADGTPCVLDISFTSRVNSRWMKLAENIDFRKTVRFSAWHDKKQDAIAFNVQQDGVSVPQKYTREEPGDLPEPIQKRSGEWDYGAQEDFLYERMVSIVIPTVEAAAALRPLRMAATADAQDDVKKPEGIATDNAEHKTQGLEDEGDPFRDAPDPATQDPTSVWDDIPF